MRTVPTLLALLAALACGGADEAPDPGPLAPGGFAFTHVNVVPMDEERVLEDRTVFVREDRIVAIGKSDELRLPPAVRVVDGGGAYLLPGLADMHVHALEEAELLLLVANGVTTIRIMFGSMDHIEWRDEIASGERLGPTIVTAGPILDGDPPIWPGSAVATTPTDARILVAEQKRAGYDGIKVYNGLPLAAYAAAVSSATSYDMPVWGHVPDAVGLAGAFQVGQRSIEHLSGYGRHLLRDDAPDDVARGMLARISGRASAWMDASRFEDVAEDTVDAGVWNCPTLVVKERIVRALAGDRELLALPGMELVPAETRASWEARLRDDVVADEIEELWDGHRMRMALVAALHDEEAGLLLGTDASNPFVVHGFAVHDELDLLVEAGLTPYEALATGTREAARFLEMPGLFGEVRIGARADLVLVRGNPLEDVATLRKPLGVLVAGRWMPRELIDALLARLAE